MAPSAVPAPPLTDVIAAVDFSDSSDGVLAEATTLAASYGAVLHLVHVAPPEPAFVGWDDPGGPNDRDTHGADMGDRRHRLEVLATEVATSTGVITRAVVVAGATVDALVTLADTFDRSLIVVGSHGEGRLRRLLVGSTTDGLLRRADRPVLVVPSPTAD